MATAPLQFDANVTEEKILAAVQRIVAVANPIRIIAFGSRARGDFRPNSDLDLAVIVDHLPLEPSRPSPEARSTQSSCPSTCSSSTANDTNECCPGREAFTTILAGKG